MREEQCDSFSSSPHRHSPHFFSAPNLSAVQAKRLPPTKQTYTVTCFAIPTSLPVLLPCVNENIYFFTFFYIFVLCDLSHLTHLLGRCQSLSSKKMAFFFFQTLPGLPYFLYILMFSWAKFPKHSILDVFLASSQPRLPLSQRYP